MNWLVIAVVGGAAAWFELNYQLSRREAKKKAAASAKSSPQAGRTTAQVAQPRESLSIAPGAENDKQLNTPA